MPALFLAFIVFLLDQWSKHLIQAQMLPGQSIPVISNIFHITYVLNPGAAFGILAHQTAVFILIAVLLLGGVLYYYRRIPPQYWLVRPAMGLVTGGAAGNLVDRVRTGYVVDFFDFRIWPVFNIADSAIVVGVALIAITLLYFNSKEVEQHE